MIKRKQFRHGANSANPKSLFEVLGLDKSNDPNYKLNPSFMSSGRAGRDGERADCILYYSYQDKII